MYFYVPIIKLFVGKLIRVGGGWRHSSFDPIIKRGKMFLWSWEEGPKNADIV